MEHFWPANVRELKAVIDDLNEEKWQDDNSYKVTEKDLTLIPENPRQSNRNQQRQEPQPIERIYSIPKTPVEWKALSDEFSPIDSWSALSRKTSLNPSTLRKNYEECRNSNSDMSEIQFTGKRQRR
jgi:hypothetical protein